MKILEIIIVAVWTITFLGLLCLGVDKLFYSCKKGNLKKKVSEYKSKRAKKKMLKDDSKKQIRKHNMKKDTINFDALKFEHEKFYKIIKEIVSNFNISNVKTVETYLIKFDECVKKNSFEKLSENNLLMIACLIKAIIDEPVIKDEENQKYNLNIITDLIHLYKKKDVEYENKALKYWDKEDLQMDLLEKHFIHKDDVYIIAFYLTEKLF